MADFKEFLSLQFKEVHGAVVSSVETLLAEQLQRVAQELVSHYGDSKESLKQGDLQIVLPKHLEIVNANADGGTYSMDATQIWRAETWRVEDDDMTHLPEVKKESSQLSVESAISLDFVRSPFDRQISPAKKTLKLHQLWEQEQRISKTNSRRLENHLLRRPSRFGLRSGEEILGTGCLQKLVMRPSSFRCLLWDLFCGLAIIYDTIMVPLFSSFPIDTSLPGLQIIEATSTSIWVLDMLASFLRGFLDTNTGFVEMRLEKIAWHYLGTWFLPDITMLGVDMVSLFLVDQKAAATVTLLRLFRNLRLVRLVKIAGRLSRLKEVFLGWDYGLEWTSVYLATGMTVIKQITVISLLCHFSGCAWYALGTLDLEKTWVQEYTVLNQEDILYLYVTSLHWSLTQFTPASIDVAAVNVPERIFSVVLTLAGLIVFSLFIGSINQALAKLTTLTAQETRQHQLVRRYVTEKRISVELSADILRCIRQRGLGKESSKLVLSDIKILESLPPKLLVQLRQEVGIPILESHGFFKHVNNLKSTDTTLGALCYRALQEVSVVYGEELFTAGIAGEKMYFVRTGQLSYNWDATPHLTDDVEPESRVSEASLWLQWEYRGRFACAAQSSHLFQLDAMTFRKVTTRCEHADLFSLYARLFLKMLEAELEAMDEDASDLFGDDQQVQKMLKLCAVMVRAGAGTDIRAVFIAWKGQVNIKSQIEVVQGRLCCLPVTLSSWVRKHKQHQPNSEAEENDVS